MQESDDTLEERFQQAIADQLGITAEELDEWCILDERELTDDGLIDSHFVEFDKQTPVELLTRMGLQQGKPLVKHVLPIHLDGSDYGEHQL